MLFFQQNFLVLFLTPTLILVSGLKAIGLRQPLPWIASAASLIFLYINSDISLAIAIVSICLNYFGARYLLSHRSKQFLIAIITINLAILGYFKYSILIDKTLFGNTLPLTWRIALPLGISFYTFQQIAFVSDVYWGKVTSFSFRSYALFKLFFPQFIAGPIVHFERVRSSYERWPTFNARSIKFALTIFALGCAKKLLGDFFAETANIGFASQATLGVFTAWVTMLAFTFQIYFDFSGYSDMAVGLARLFGVSLPFNFNSPYKSKSISEFWRRWHITLSNWLRDYLYIPLGGSRNGAQRTIVALFTTMALGGLWHGANWTFLVWGAAHGIALILTRFFGFPAPNWLKQPAVFVFVALTWILFRSQTWSGAVAHFQALIDLTKTGAGVEIQRIVNLVFPQMLIESTFNKPRQVYECAAIVGALLMCFALPNSQQISLWASSRHVHAWLGLYIGIAVAVIAALSFALVTPDNTNAFIYFEF